MRFHFPSYLLGVASAATVMAFPKRFRPIIVEAAAVGQTIIRTGRTIFERQREALDDLWAEISVLATERMRQPSAPTNGQHRSTATSTAPSDARV